MVHNVSCFNPQAFTRCNTMLFGLFSFVISFELPVFDSLTIIRHLSISLDMLLKLVRIFGSVIYSTISASTSVGVDIEAEQRCVWLHLQFSIFLFFSIKILSTVATSYWYHRLERCNLCFIELEKVKRCLSALTRCLSKFV